MINNFHGPVKAKCISLGLCKLVTFVSHRTSIFVTGERASKCEPSITQLTDERPDVHVRVHVALVMWLLMEAFLAYIAVESENPLVPFDMTLKPILGREITTTIVTHKDAFQAIFTTGRSVVESFRYRQSLMSGVQWIHRLSMWNTFNFIMPVLRYLGSISEYILRIWSAETILNLITRNVHIQFRIRPLTFTDSCLFLHCSWQFCKIMWKIVISTTQLDYYAWINTAKHNIWKT